MKITKNIFTDLAILMISFGIVIGILFPFFLLYMSVPKEYLFTGKFFISTILAGMFVGGVNIAFARIIVERKAKKLSNHMKFVEEKIMTKSYKDSDPCIDNSCYVSVDTNDEIAKCGMSFNKLVDALSVTMRSEDAARNFSEMLSSQLELESLSKKTIETLMKFTNSDAGAILIESDGELKVTSQVSIKNPETLLTSSMVQNVLENKERRIVTLPDEVLIENGLITFKPKSILVEPILHKSVPLGAIVLGSTSLYDNSVFSDLELFSGGLSLAYRNALSHHKMQSLAANDPLTGVSNRRFGLSRLKDEFKHSLENGSEIGIIMFDLDHFKAVNDTYGHVFGDQVLVKAARLAKKALRTGDVLLRYGGEEFLAILPGASKENLIQIAEKLRRLIADAVHKIDDNEVRVTVSIGGVSFPETDCNSDKELVNLADEALYKAKELGRDRYIIN